MRAAAPVCRAVLVLVLVLASARPSHRQLLPAELQRVQKQSPIIIERRLGDTKGLAHFNQIGSNSVALSILTDS